MAIIIVKDVFSLGRLISHWHGTMFVLFTTLILTRTGRCASGLGLLILVNLVVVQSLMMMMLYWFMGVFTTHAYPETILP